MAEPDLNLLLALDALLEERSVTRAGRRLRLSPSAASRTLTRLRRTTGDPLLVPEGRGLVLTPHALALRGRVRAALDGARDVLAPAAPLDPARLERTFSVRAGDGFVEAFGAVLVERVAREAPGVRLRFLGRDRARPAAADDVETDVETGVLDLPVPSQVSHRPLFEDRFVTVVHPDHPLAAAGPGGRPPVAGFAAARHVRVSRRGRAIGRLDDAFAGQGLVREVTVTVDGFAAALALVRSAGLVTTVPERHTAGLRSGLVALVPPVALPTVTVSLQWHARHDADPAHRWLRERVADATS